MTRPPSAPPPAPARDPGLQPERTLLAWSRTALLLTVDALLVLRAGLLHRQPGLSAIGCLLTATACGFFGYGLHRRRRLERTGGDPEPVPVGPLRVLTLAVTLAAAGSAWSVLAGPGGR
ncbi:DUF202 domain-containing protein [Kitasatospora sp. NPDC094015]|uniref:DUF202 domain-containing protein n=1 Tax=Kitasatospora sp. NPDC094015 TaxID=3155205 RepID=UPI00332D23BA